MSVELGSSKVLAENTTPVAPPGPAEPGSLPAPQDLVEPGALVEPAVVVADAAIDTRTLSRSLFLRLAALDRAAPTLRARHRVRNVPTSGTRSSS